MIRIAYRKNGVNREEVWFCNEQFDFTSSKADIITMVQSSKQDGLISTMDFHTLITDLSEDKDSIFNNIDKQCRYEIRRAEKEGTNVEYYGIKDTINNSVIEDFMKKYTIFAKQKSLPTINKNNLLSFNKFNKLIISKSSIDGEGVVYHTYVVDDSRVRLWHSISLYRDDSSPSQRALVGRLNRNLHWSDMIKFKEHGILVYDWGGISDSDEIQNITKFKRSFGGNELIEYNYLVNKTLKGKIFIKLRNIIRRG